MKIIKKVFIKTVRGFDGTEAYNIIASIVDIKNNKIGFLKYSSLFVDIKENYAMTPHEFKIHWQGYFFPYDIELEKILKTKIKEDNYMRWSEWNYKKVILFLL